ncbi:MAG: GNAT family N-acetyltransferase [Burkholderiaceae bacterium]|nr:MAG: GNAT family N-acetyltransferase [Burkholderiaceae bacterium]
MSKRDRDHELELGETESVEVFQHTDQLAPDVLALFEEAEADNLRLGAPWYQNLIDTVYPAHGGVHIYVLRRGGKAIAALPVLATKGKLGWAIESLGNYYTSLYAPATAPEAKYQDVALLISAASQAHAPTIAFRFSPMDPESRSYRRLWDALEANGLAAFGFFCFGNWYLPVVSDGAGYLRGREGQLRSTIKRHGKKFQAAGGRLEIITGDGDLERGLAAYEHVYASSWKHAEPYPAFIPGLAHIGAGSGALRLGIAWLNDKAVAAQLWIVTNGTANVYKLAYDESYKAYAPGTLLTAFLMETVIDKDRPTEIDYLIGDDAYKKTWMSDRRERWGIIAYNPRTFGGMLSLCKEVVGRLLKPLRVRLRAAVAATSVHT